MIATFHPQAWINNHAIEVDPAGETQWRISDDFVTELGGMPEPYTYERDALKGDPTAPEWVREWTGPFEISIEGEE